MGTWLNAVTGDPPRSTFHVSTGLYNRLICACWWVANVADGGVSSLNAAGAQGGLNSVNLVHEDTAAGSVVLPSSPLYPKSGQLLFTFNLLSFFKLCSCTLRQSFDDRPLKSSVCCAALVESGDRGPRPGISPPALTDIIGGDTSPPPGQFVSQWPRPPRAPGATSRALV